MNKRGPALMDKKISNEYIVFTIFISAGIMLRFIAMSLGHNYDFESYCVVGEIAGNLKNVYANTVRYNYGPIFFMIQGTLYRLAHRLRCLCLLFGNPHGGQGHGYAGRLFYRECYGSNFRSADSAYRKFSL